MAEMETEKMLCSWYGEAAAKATLARNILAPVAGRLSGHPSELHSRCILVRRLSCSTDTRDLCERFSTYETIEAVALSGILRMAVVVFKTVAGWRAAAAATLSDCCDTVPPLYFGPPVVVVGDRDIKVALHPNKLAAAAREKDVSSFGALDGDEIGRLVEPTTAFVPSAAAPSLKNIWP